MGTHHKQSPRYQGVESPAASNVGKLLFWFWGWKRRNSTDLKSTRPAFHVQGDIVDSGTEKWNVGCGVNHECLMLLTRIQATAWLRICIRRPYFQTVALLSLKLNLVLIWQGWETWGPCGAWRRGYEESSWSDREAVRSFDTSLLFSAQPLGLKQLEIYKAWAFLSAFSFPLFLSTALIVLH